MDAPASTTTARDRRGYGGHAEALRDDLKRLILDLGLRPGDPIPSESSLIETLEVSRGSLREGLKSLQAQGIIETRHGAGTFVGHLSFEALAEGLVFHMRLNGADDLGTVAELAEIREILETQLIRRVAGGMTDQQDATLSAIVDEMDALVLVNDDSTALDDLDRRFHAELYSRLDRRLVIELLEAFWRALNVARPHLPEAFISSKEAVDKHRAIVTALRGGDADLASMTMKEHFAATRQWVAQIG